MDTIAFKFLRTVAAASTFGAIVAALVLIVGQSLPRVAIGYGLGFLTQD